MILPSKKTPNTLQAAITKAFTRVPLGAFLFVFLAESLYSLVQTSSEASHPNPALLRGALIFLPLLLAALLALWLSRKVARNLIQQLGGILNAVNGVHSTSDNEKIIYTDLISFKRNLDDLLEIKRSHDEQVSRLRIAKQLEHDIHSPLLLLRMILPKVSGIAFEEKTALLSAVHRITAISMDIGRLAPNPGSTPKAITRDEGLSSMIRVKQTLEDLVIEKRLETSNRNPILLEFDQKLHELGLCARQETFSRVISNLINNAIEASPPKSVILILVRLAEDQSLILSVMDQGKGIPSSELENLGAYGFTHGKPKGSGVGLFSAREFLSDLGAKLEVDSILEVGTTVSMRFPKECPAVVL